MKVLIIALMTLTASAAIKNSNFEARHENEIIESITNKCNWMKNLTVTSTKSEEVKVDQGITDVKYTTTLTGKQIYDQNIYDHYEITVVSWLSDDYDHQSQEYGWYNVESVECELL